MSKSKLPKWAEEVQERIGLTLRLNGDFMNECDVLSPTGIVLFRMGGLRNNTVGMVSMPDMYQLHPESDR